MKRSLSVYVIGAGGHAKVVLRALQDSGVEEAMLFDDAPERQGTTLLGMPVVGPVEHILDYPPRPTVIAIGDNSARRRIADSYALSWITVIHPRALLDSTVRVGEGTMVLANAIVQVDSRIGRHVIINHAATVDHDCTIEDFVHLAPGVHLAGNVTVRKGVLMGIGAVALPGVEIGEETIVGAGAVVTHDLPARVVAVGVPARIIAARAHGAPGLISPATITTETMECSGK